MQINLPVAVCCYDSVVKLMKEQYPDAEINLLFMDTAIHMINDKLSRSKSHAVKDENVIEVKNVDLTEEQIRTLRSRPCTCKKLIYGNHSKLCAQYLLNAYKDRKEDPFL